MTRSRSIAVGISGISLTQRGAESGVGIGTRVPERVHVGYPANRAAGSGTGHRVSATYRRRTRQARPQVDPALQGTVTSLADAVDGLAGPQPRHHDGVLVWAPSRYAQLRGALTGGKRPGGRRRGGWSTMAPCFVDALKLLLAIDSRTAEIARAHGDTRELLEGLAVARWRVEDVRLIEAITGEVLGWVKAVDDLFASHPIYLPDPCPECRQSWTHRWNDEGQLVRAPALAVTVEHGCICQSCHATWSLDRLVFLGRVLGYRLEGLVEQLPS